MWRISTDRRGRRPPLLVYAGGWPEPSHNPYNPLAEAPRLYEEFAALGEHASQVGRRLAPSGGETAPYVVRYATEEIAEYVSVEAPEPAERLVIYAEEDRVIQSDILDFVQDHGPLRFLTTVEMSPRRYGHDWIVGMLLSEFLREAWSLAKAIRLTKEVRDGEDEGRDDEDLQAKQEQLQRAIWDGLEGVRLVLLRERDRVGSRLLPSHTCTDLLSAMWLQFYGAVAGGKPWRICKGCGHLFNATDARQEYHDSACRNRANVRRSTRKLKAKNGG